MVLEDYALANYHEELYANGHELQRLANRISKALLDYSIALPTTILSLPIIAISAIAIKRESPGPVFYIPTRIGEHGKPIKMYKLRSMYEEGREFLERRIAEGYTEEAEYLADKERMITRVGRVLRKYSIDELSQLWDVLLLRMSLVGPRPLHPLEVDNLPEYAYERFSCPAGMTGDWQISDRPNVGKRTNLDIEYARMYNSRWILPHDLKILAGTVGYVLLGKNR